MKKELCFLGVLLFVSLPVQAKVVPNSLFSDRAVLQSGVPVPVWGSADKGERVSVTFNGQTKETVETDGKWMVQLDAMPVGGPYEMKICGAEEEVNISDLYVGEVWLCSGQSNMARQLKPHKSQKPIHQWEAERDAAQYPLIRQYYVPILSADEPLADAKSQWVICSPETVGDFTCVGYFFARDLHKALQGVPVGIIFSAVGGTPSEFWTSRSELESHPEFKEMVEKYDQSLMDFAKAQARYKRTKVGKAPVNPAEQRHVFGHYNAMIAPLVPYAIKGVTWYQGEANKRRSEQYRTLFPFMIQNWRKDWKQGDFPFLFVQVAPFRDMPPEIREAQFLAWKETSETAMIVTSDCGDPLDIHPAYKQPVGYRLALAARALAYGEKLEYSGPVYEFMKIQDDEAVIYFSHTGEGLVSQEGELKGFTIAGKDGKFVPAQAEITSAHTVRVKSAEVKEPAAVRYGWDNVPEVNLCNKALLPASPFRTDVK